MASKNNIKKVMATELGMEDLVKRFLTNIANKKTYEDKSKTDGNAIKEMVDNMVTVGNSLTLTVKYADGTTNGVNISKTKKPSTKAVVKAGYEEEYAMLMQRLAEITEKPEIEIVTIKEHRDYNKQLK